MSKNISYMTAPATQVLPFLDGIFAVAFTLIAYSLPEELRPGKEGIRELLIAITSFLLGGLGVILYWFKLRRLVSLAKELHTPQLLLGFLNLLIIVTLPKMVALAVRYGQGQGNVSSWTTSQIVNTLYLATLFLLDCLILLFALSIRERQTSRGRSHDVLRALIHSQTCGLIVLLVLGIMEILFIWFNSEYVLLVPIVLILEECLIARQFSQA